MSLKRTLQLVGNLIITISILSLSSQKSNGQSIYSVDASNPAPPIISGQLKLGAAIAPNGNTLTANNMYFIRNGKPWFPVMGEVHFSRIPRERWESTILKMKAAGIDVIASYVFWIYHEEQEGKFNWAGNKDLMAFAKLCKKHNVFLFMRIGPWCHGEVRNGGFPDWIIRKGNARKNDSIYLASVQKFYDEIGKQLHGMYFKDGGPVIGTQIENEFKFNNAAGLQHILTLKAMAIKAGINVPFYTATGWPGSDQKQDEIIPVWGGYPEAPWDKKITKLDLSPNYVFSMLRDDPAIGSDLLRRTEKETANSGYRYPYGTAEMGGGNQITYHRRPIISADDVTALAYVKTGSGANLMGYYMFTGGSNSIGKLSTLQESKATKYPNDYTIINYDFQSPIGEWGELRQSYRGFKAFHLFLNDFGDRLVQDYPAFPNQKPSGPADQTILRFATRSKGESGFLFINNYQRQAALPTFNDVQFKIKLPKDTLTFPDKPVNINKGLQAVLPFNMAIDGLMLQYATVQPLCKITGATPLYIFFAHEGLRPEYVFSATKNTLFSSVNATVKKSNNKQVISNLVPGTNCMITATLPSGKKVSILTITDGQALDAWKGIVNNKEYFFISNQELTFPDGHIKIESEGNPVLRFSAFPALPVAALGKQKPTIARDGFLTSYVITLPSVRIKATMQEVKDIIPFQNKGVQLPADQRLPDYTTTPSPGPQYQTNLTPVSGSIYYNIQLSGDFTKLSDAYVVLNYTGDTGSAYIDGKLVADDFYSGAPMRIGFDDLFKDTKSGRFLFQIVPLTDNRKIFFEDGIREPLAGKSTANLSAVSVIPKYGLELKN